MIHAGIIIHRNGVVIHANNEYLRILRGNIEDIIGHQSMKRIHPNDVKKVRQQMDLDRSYYENIKLKRYDDTYISIEGRATNIYYPGAGHCRILSIRELNKGVEG